MEKLRNDSSSGIYVKVLMNEKLKPQLLEYCQLHNGAIASYYAHLLPEYQNEVDLLFLKYIKSQADIANNRKEYRSVCVLIQKYKKACGKSAANAIQAELATENTRRPAFLDELSKI